MRITRTNRAKGSFAKRNFAVMDQQGKYWICETEQEKIKLCQLVFPCKIMYCHINTNVLEFYGQDRNIVNFGITSDSFILDFISENNEATSLRIPLLQETEIGIMMDRTQELDLLVFSCQDMKIKLKLQKPLSLNDLKNIEQYLGEDEEEEDFACGSKSKKKFAEIFLRSTPMKKIVY